MKLQSLLVRVLSVSLALLIGFSLSAGAAGVTFQDIAAGGGSGLAYHRAPSERLHTLEGIQADGRLDLINEYPLLPVKTYGGPGVAVLDYDNDGDLDIYVTNGPGRNNSLFKNRLRETGSLSFQDVATSAGAALKDQDSNGVCFGDIENDGDLDLFVTGYMGNRLLKNRGNGKFTDITASSGAGGQPVSSVSCAMGDINGDALPDIVVANTFDLDNNLAYGYPFWSPFQYHRHNQLLVNQGDNTFVDASASSGIQDIAGIPEPGAALVTWTVAMIDIDLDGDLDIFTGNDEHSLWDLGDLGLPRLFRNDGTGHFTDETYTANLDRVGDWHSLSFGDLNCDGRLDLFGSNFGDYSFAPGAFPVGAYASRWLLGESGGTFSDPGVGALVTTPTGWGSAIADYDNDGDSDIIYHGGLEFTIFWDESNPGVLLNNQGCSAVFNWDTAPLAGSANHYDRNVEGVATGDFNNDGFVDIVTVSSFDVVPGTPRVPADSAPLGSPFDPFGTWVFIAHPDPTDFLFWLWDFVPRNQGTLTVEINSGNSNRWAAFDVMGSHGVVDNSFATGRVGRDGIGAIVRFTPQGGQPAMVPVMGGSGFASQGSLRAQFGLGSAVRGTAEVQWPGGVKNRLYNVFASERVLLPEIPCSYDSSMSPVAYTKCVTASLGDLLQAHALTPLEALRLEVSALRAYAESH